MLISNLFWRYSIRFLCESYGNIFGMLLQCLSNLWICYEIGVGLNHSSVSTNSSSQNKNFLLCTHLRSIVHTATLSWVVWLIGRSLRLYPMIKPKTMGKTEQFRELFLFWGSANIKAHTHMQHKLTLDVCKSIKCSLTCRDHYSVCNANSKAVFVHS